MIGRIWLLFFCIVLNVVANETAITKKVKLAWDSVEGSKAYELEIYSGQALLLKETVIALSWETRLEPGQYRYRVRALDEFDRYGSWTSFEEFQIQPSASAEVTKAAPVKRSKSSVRAMAAYGSYDYGSEVGGLGFGRASGATEFSLEAGIEYWFVKSFAAAFDASYKSSELETVKISYPEFDISLRYSVLKDSMLYFNPLISFEYQNTPEITSVSVGPAILQNNYIRSMGLGVGAELGGNLSESWALEAWFRYIYPLNYSSSNVEKARVSDSRIYRYGATLSYFFKPQWCLGLEFVYDYRELAYDTASNSRAKVNKDTMRGGLSLKSFFGKVQ